MVRIVISFFLFTCILFGDMIDDKIKSFIGEKEYLGSQKIISILLGDKKQYYLGDKKVDVVKLLKVLKKNGFMRLDLKSVNSVSITFTTKGNPLLFLKILNTTLNSMGFNFYITKKALKNSDGFSWTIQMNSEYLVDPVVLSNELKKYGCSIVDIVKKSKTNWSYFISSSNAKLLSKEVNSMVSYRLKKPIKRYWLTLLDMPKTINIKSYPLNRWHPYIAFFDSNLDILSVYSSDEVAKNLELDIPEDSKYIMIDDKYTISNIRSGLKIYTKGHL